MRLVFIFIFTFFLLGCQKEVELPNDPKETILNYFELIYNEKQIEGTDDYLTEEYYRVISHYGHAPSVARYIYGTGDLNDVRFSVVEQRNGVQFHSRTKRYELSIEGYNAEHEIQRDLFYINLILPEGSKRWVINNVKVPDYF